MATAPSGTRPASQGANIPPQRATIQEGRPAWPTPRRSPRPSTYEAAAFADSAACEPLFGAPSPRNFLVNSDAGYPVGISANTARTERVAWLGLGHPETDLDGR